MRELNDAQSRRTPNIQNILAGPAVRTLPILYHEEDRDPIDGGINRDGGPKDGGKPSQEDSFCGMLLLYTRRAVASYQRTINGNSEARGHGVS